MILLLLTVNYIQCSAANCSLRKSLISNRNADTQKRLASVPFYIFNCIHGVSNRLVQNKKGYCTDQN